MDKVQIVSFNVNGLGKKSKRLAIFNLIKQNNESIFLLQETFSRIEVEETWKDELPSGHLIFNHGTNRSKGVLIYIPKQKKL